MMQNAQTPGLPAGRPELLGEAVIAEIEGLEGVVLSSLLSLYFDGAASDLTDISGAIGRGETLTVSRTAHKLKGGSSTIGAARVSHIASQLEASAKAGDLTVAHELLDSLRCGLDETREAFRSRAAEPTTHGNGSV
ncbi:MAG: Hpt domain [Thermoleophilaceae bacterium]|jgi:HPt (histidine-containing phosphotransfer) domain-containing protein|nr:Hpt domain [Thermoleophilaceae bacterium]